MAIRRRKKASNNQDASFKLRVKYSSEFNEKKRFDVVEKMHESALLSFKQAYLDYPMAGPVGTSIKRSQYNRSYGQ